MKCPRIWPWYSLLKVTLVPSLWHIPGGTGVSRGFGEAAIPLERRSWFSSAQSQDSPLARCPLSQSLFAKIVGDNVPPCLPATPQPHTSPGTITTALPRSALLFAPRQPGGPRHAFPVLSWAQAVAVPWESDARGPCDFTCKWWPGCQIQKASLCLPQRRQSACVRTCMCACKQEQPASTAERTLVSATSLPCRRDTVAWL